MPLVVISGGPGVGKTTLLHELARRGHRVVTDTAREVIAKRKQKGLTPRPSPNEFASEVFRQDRSKYTAVRQATGVVFFDRSPLDSLGMLHEASPLAPSELKAMVSLFTFVSPVFILPPWRAIYTTDAERDQSFGDALLVHVRTAAWYSGLGYALNEVPPGPVGSRADHVLRALESEA